MRWPGITVNATVLTTAIGIQRKAKRNVRTIVGGQDGTSIVAEKLSAWGWIFAGVIVRPGFVIQRNKPVGRIGDCSPTCGWSVHVYIITVGIQIANGSFSIQNSRSW